MYVPVFYRKDRLRCFPELKMPARGGHDDKTILGLDDIVNRQSKISFQDLAQFLNADKHSPASSAQSTKWRVRGDAYVCFILQRNPPSSRRFRYSLPIRTTISSPTFTRSVPARTRSAYWTHRSAVQTESASLLINGTVYTVEDLGTPYGHVDIYFGSHSEALAFGLQSACLQIELRKQEKLRQVLYVLYSNCETYNLVGLVLF